MESVSKFLIGFSGFLDFAAKKLSGAAFRLSPEMAISQADCEDQNWQNVRPCFVLSTGRSGILPHQIVDEHIHPEFLHDANDRLAVQYLHTHCCLQVAKIDFNLPAIAVQLGQAVGPIFLRVQESRDKGDLARAKTTLMDLVTQFTYGD